MDVERIAWKSLCEEAPPAVVLGDLSLVRPVAMGGIPFILATPEPDDIALRSRQVRHHRVVADFRSDGRERAVAELCDLGARIERALGRRAPLFYNSDPNLELIYRHRAAFERHFLLVLNDPETAWALHDKDRFYALTERHGVPTPRTLRSGAAIDRDLDTLREPILVKPKVKTADWHTIQRDLFDGSGKARVFATRAQLRGHPGFARHKDAVVVQEFVGSDVADLYSFHGFADATGTILASYVGRKLRTYPSFAGESCYIELTHDATVERFGREVIAKLGVRGPFKVDLIRDARARDAGWAVLEINARYNLWNHLGAACGVNLLRVAYDHLVYGRAPRAHAGYDTDRRWVHFYRDLQAYREQSRRGEISFTRWLGSLADPRHVHETFAWDDPEPFLHWAGALVRQRLGHETASGTAR